MITTAHKSEGGEVEKFVTPYRVLSAGGLTIGRFDDFVNATKAYERWPQAAAIVQGTRVVMKKWQGDKR